MKEENDTDETLKGCLVMIGIFCFVLMVVIGLIEQRSEEISKDTVLDRLEYMTIKGFGNLAIKDGSTGRISPFYPNYFGKSHLKEGVDFDLLHKSEGGIHKVLWEMPTNATGVIARVSDSTAVIDSFFSEEALEAVNADTVAFNTVTGEILEGEERDRALASYSFMLGGGRWELVEDQPFIHEQGQYDLLRGDIHNGRGQRFTVSFPLKDLAKMEFSKEHDMNIYNMPPPTGFRIMEDADVVYNSSQKLFTASMVDTATGKEYIIKASREIMEKYERFREVFSRYDKLKSNLK